MTAAAHEDDAAEVAVAWWTAEADAKDHLAEIREGVTAEETEAWLADAKAREQARRHLDELRADQARRRRFTQPPPPAPEAQPQRLDVFHHGIDEPASKRGGLRSLLSAKLIGFAALCLMLGLAFLVLIGFAIATGGTSSMPEKARTEVLEQGWTCEDVDTVEALTVDDDGTLWHWITPIGHCS